MTGPFLKWPGGKRWLADSGCFPQPDEFRRYVEPFLGGGAIFFYLRPDRALLSDLNPNLVALYTVIRDRPGELFEEMICHEENHSKQYYYQIREFRPRSDIRRAARFLYLNRTCWNGLYRVNLDGDFNVPIGTKDSIMFDDEDFWEISKALRNAEIQCSDFEVIVDRCTSGDFLFIDPPYTVQHNYNGFLKYNEHIFSWDDQVRLRDSVERAVQRGAAIALTNADHSSIRALYADVCEYVQVNRHSKLAADATRRGLTSEALFIANITNRRLNRGKSASDARRTRC